MQILLFMADLTAVNSFTDAVKWSLYSQTDKSTHINCAYDFRTMLRNLWQKEYIFMSTKQGFVTTLTNAEINWVYTFLWFHKLLRLHLEINQEFKLNIRNLDAVKRESKEVGPSVFVTVNKGWWRRAGDSSKGKPEIESAVCPSTDKAIKSYAHKPPAWIKLFLPIGTKENLLRKNKPALNGGVVIMEVCISAASRGNVAAETVLLYRKYGIVWKLKVTVPWVKFYWIPIR